MKDLQKGREVMPYSSIRHTTHKKWLTATDFVGYLISEKEKCSLLQTDTIQDMLSYLNAQKGLQPEQLIQELSGLVEVSEMPFQERNLSSLLRLSQIVFLVNDNKIIPAEYFDVAQFTSQELDYPRVYFLSAPLPKQKLTKIQFVNTLMARRWSIIPLALGLGTPPVIAAALAELFEQPLFDNFVPEGRVPSIIFIGFATIALQLSAQLLTTMQTLAQSYFTQNLDLETKIATAKRYLQAQANALPKKDIGSWRLTFSVAAAFLDQLTHCSYQFL